MAELESPVLALLIKWGVEAKNYGNRKSDIEDMLDAGRVIAHISDYKRIPQQMGLPFEETELISPALSVLSAEHQVMEISNLEAYYRLINSWRESRGREIRLFSFSTDDYQEMLKELITGGNRPIRFQEMRFLYKMPSIGAGERLMLITKKDNRQLIVKVESAKFYQVCLSAWDNGVIQGFEPYIITKSVWDIFSKLYDRRVEKLFYEITKKRSRVA